MMANTYNNASEINEYILSQELTEIVKQEKLQASNAIATTKIIFDPGNLDAKAGLIIIGLKTIKNIIDNIVEIKPVLIKSKKPIGMQRKYEKESPIVAK